MMRVALARTGSGRLRFRSSMSPLRLLLVPRGSMPRRWFTVLVAAGCGVVVHAAAASVLAGTVTGRVDVPATDGREPSSSRGYLEPVDNAILPIQPFNPMPLMVVVLEPESPVDVVAPPQASYDLKGESFARPVLAVVKGQEVVIRNLSFMPRTLAAKEDDALIPKGTLNVTGSKSFRVAEANKIYTIGDPAVPHLIGRIVSIATPHHSLLDREGRFTLDNVPAGTYKARVFFRDHWLSPETAVTMPGGNRAKVEIRISIPADYRVSK
jgi:hypothetical protein